MTRPVRRLLRGHSLIELMIALAIALLLMLGLTTVLVQMKGVFGAQDQWAQLQDNERLALTILSTTVQAAGYFPDPASRRATEALPALTGPFGQFAAGQGLVGQGHTLTSRYSAAPGDPWLVNCLGQPNATGAMQVLINTFSINAQHELLCSTDGGLSATPLVSNVTGLQVLYGTDSTGSGQVDRYLAADQVHAALLWSRVRSVRLTLNFSNPLSPATITWTQTVDLMNRR